MSTPTYTDRHLERQTVARIDRRAVTGSGGLTASAPPEVIERLHVGKRYSVETRGGPWGTICGWWVDGQWYARKSDQQLEAERQEMLDGFAARRREELAKHWGEWIGREENLPGWLKDRIHVFHERGGEKFELEGWGYELVVCELAALYADSGCEDSPAVLRFADEQGTSVNQHDCAKALARAHLRGQPLAGTVAALAPLTGSAFYAVGGTEGATDA